jgi:pimeloyl-ACP methyl ester carboxylesterase
MLHFTDWGSGRVILMLHGNLSTCRWWERLAPLLPQGWRAICPDFRGYGRSESAPQGYNAEAMAEDVLALVDELGVEEYVVAGHSMGGAVALLMALQCPPRVLALGLFDPVPASGVKLAEGTLAMMQQMRADRAMLRSSLAWIASAAPRDDYFESLVEDAGRSGEQAWRDVPVSFAQFDITGRLDQITCPVLCVMGEDDGVIPAGGVAAMCSRLKHCEQIMLEGVGHCPQTEAPLACAAALERFLSRLPAEHAIA